MKIVYVITKSNWGGAQRQVFDLATAMRSSGHDVWVALGGNGALKDNLEAAGIYTFSISELGRDISLRADFQSFRKILSVIKDKKPDILHLHSPKAAGLGSLAGRILRVPKIITTVHGWTFNESRPWYQVLTIRFFSWLTMLLSHTTILLSEKEYGQARSFPKVKAKIELITLGIKPVLFMSIDGSKQTIAKLIGLNQLDFEKKTVIGTIAELHPNKGLDYLITATKDVVTQYPNTICVIIGDGQDKEKIRKLISDGRLERNIYLAGQVENASQYLKAFNIFVLPSTKEGLPYTILEAGCASLPVVATSVGGIPEIIDDMKSGILVQSKNSKELGHALSFMIEHPEERRRYGTNLREKILSKFQMEKMLRSIEELYNRKIGNAKPE